MILDKIDFDVNIFLGCAKFVPTCSLKRVIQTMQDLSKLTISFAGTLCKAWGYRYNLGLEKEIEIARYKGD